METSPRAEERSFITVMAAVQIPRLLLYFLITTSIVGAETATDADDRHVVIGPVENVTAYLTGSTNIVVAWDPPPVYLIHDVINATLDELVPGTEVVVSKQQSSAVIDQTSVTNESTNSSNVTSSVASDSDGTGGNNETSTMIDYPTPSSIWKCQPISFFDNYTVAMKEDPDFNDTSMGVAFKGSIQEQEKLTVNVKENQTVVMFSEGCISRYEISWGKTENESTVLNMTVPATAHTANITGLKPATQYKIVIKAVYVSGHTFDNESPAYFTTTLMDEPEACSCDMYGAISPSLGCNFTRPSLCNCKPGYQGIFCEMCAPGYYRIASHFPCHRCPCDAHSTRRSTCRFVEGFLQCDNCEVGYTGNICHMCDKGFYRFNRHCVQCFCHGNTSPNAPHMCTASSGACIKCQHNTTGFNCERCLPGYIGDPITFKNCTREEDIRVRSLSQFSSSASPSVVIAIIITFLLMILLIGTVLLFRRYYSREKRRAFWTIEMKRDSDDVDFNSVHNDDARLDDADDMDYFSKHGISSSANKYSRLKEQI